jgi:hypothetical protein
MIIANQLFYFSTRPSGHTFQHPANSAANSVSQNYLSMPGQSHSLRMIIDVCLIHFFHNIHFYSVATVNGGSPSLHGELPAHARHHHPHGGMTKPAAGTS